MAEEACNARLPHVYVAMIEVSKPPVVKSAPSRLNNIENCDIDLIEVVLN